MNIAVVLDMKIESGKHDAMRPIVCESIKNNMLRA